ncbi:hypothetical protein DM02DRAFT_635132 [Periconia macrospinosa]|uniref:CCHC-type domain-containing protein n=1 Tax=Periconia macrospinosa TaxID=97972 RepID=A0A2V1D3Y2_9PLEO|nr:hypothetical protein DM02DRAFT_635132 [Periconia macrospinosa]
MGRPVTDDDIGMKVLREAPAEETQIIDRMTFANYPSIVAIHGLGTHPDDSWCKNAGTRENPRWINWLEEESMLSAIAPNARIMRRSVVKGFETEERAHCFGGLVVLKALLEAEQYPAEWPGLFRSTTGLIFFDTPFRGAEGMNQMEMLEAARREYHENEVQPTALEVLQPGNEYLEEVVDSFLKKMRGQTNKTPIACFFELKPSNVGMIVGGQDRTRVVVSASSGCLDISDSTSKYPLSRTHFNMNKFAKATEEDFELVADVIKGMINTAMLGSFGRQSTKRCFPSSTQARDRHRRRNCPKRAKDECYGCGEIGHWLEDCHSARYAYGDRNEQSEDSETNDEDVDDDSESEDEFGEY